MPVHALPTHHAGQQMMLPLTQSLYVSGEVASTDQVLVDIGTGYYVEVRGLGRAAGQALHVWGGGWREQL